MLRSNCGFARAHGCARAISSRASLTIFIIKKKMKKVNRILLIASGIFIGGCNNTPTVEESLPVKESQQEELQPITEELKEEASKKLVLSQNEAQPLFLIAGLLALALSLAAFAAGTTLRFRRRRH